MTRPNQDNLFYHTFMEKLNHKPKLFWVLSFITTLLLLASYGLSQPHEREFYFLAPAISQCIRLIFIATHAGIILIISQNPRLSRKIRYLLPPILLGVLGLVFASINRSPMNWRLIAHSITVQGQPSEPSYSWIHGPGIELLARKQDQNLLLTHFKFIAQKHISDPMGHHNNKKLTRPKSIINALKRGDAALILHDNKLLALFEDQVIFIYDLKQQAFLAYQEVKQVPENWLLKPPQG